MIKLVYKVITKKKKKEIIVKSLKIIKISKKVSFYYIFLL